MSILYEEMRVPSSDGIHILAGRVYRPEGRVRGLFHVVHGMTEHIARYDPVGFLASAWHVGKPSQRPVFSACQNTRHASTARCQPDRSASR